MKKRILCMLLCLVMVLSLFPAAVFAADDVPDSEPSVTEPAPSEPAEPAEPGDDDSGDVQEDPVAPQSLEPRGSATIVARIDGGENYATLQDAVNAANSGDTVKLLTDLVITAADMEENSRLVRLWGGKDDCAPNLGAGTSLTIDLNGRTISFADDVAKTTCTDYRFFNVWNTNLTIKNGTIDLTNDKASICSAITAYNGAVVNLDVHFTTTTNSKICFSNGSHVYINGGTYTLVVDESYENHPYVGRSWCKKLLNTSAGCPFTINGGTFVNFDPLCQCKLAHYTDSGVGDGKALTKVGNTFTVIDADSVAAKIDRTVVCYIDWGGDGTKARTYSYTTFFDAFKNAEDGDKITLLTANNDLVSLLPAGKNVTILKTKGLAITVPDSYSWQTNDETTDKLVQPTILVDDVNYETLAEAAANAKATGSTLLFLKPGSYDLNDAASYSNKTLTFKAGVDNVIFQMPTTDYQYLDLSNADWTFDGVTFAYQNTNYVGLAHTKKLTYRNCTFRGQPFLYAETEVFENCKFYQERSDAYNVWTYTAQNVTFTGCTFNSAGKSVLVYNEGNSAMNSVTFNGCTFKASQPVEGKAAVEIDTSPMPYGADVVLNNCTATGFGTGSKSGSSLWNVKGWDETVDDPKTTVTVDGKVVFPAPKMAPAYVVIYRNGDTTTPYSTVSLGEYEIGYKIDLTTLNIRDYYTANYTCEFDSYGWYNDGGWNSYKADPENAPAGLESITVNGWTNIIAMVYDYDKVVVKAVTDDNAETEETLTSFTVRKGSNLLDCLTNLVNNNLVLDRDGFTHDEWYKADSPTWKFVENDIVNDWTNVLVKYSTVTYTVTFDLNGGNVNGSTENVTVPTAWGSLVTAPAVELRTGTKHGTNGYTTDYAYDLLGWYDEEGNAFDVSTNKVYKNLTLKASWRPPCKPGSVGMIRANSFMAHCTTDHKNHPDFCGGGVNSPKVAPDGAKPELIDGVWTIKASFNAAYTVSSPSGQWKNTGMLTLWGGVKHDYTYPHGANNSTAYVKLVWDPVAEEWYPTEELVYNRTTKTYDTVKVLEDHIFYIDAKCTTEPAAPDLSTLSMVGMDGTNTDAMVKLKYTDKKGKVTWTSLSLIDGTYTVSEVTGSRAEGFTCTVTVNQNDLQTYVDQLNENRGGDWIVDTTRTKNPFKFTLTTPKNASDLSKVKWEWTDYDSKREQDNGKFIYLTRDYTVAFNTNGGSAIEPVTVRHGNTVAQPEAPTKDGYKFMGWYTDETYTTEYDFTQPLTEDKTIYAKFELKSTTIVDTYVRYDVRHIKQLSDGTYDEDNAYVEHLRVPKAAVGTLVTAVAQDYPHYSVNEGKGLLSANVVEPHVDKDGKLVYTVLSVYYDLDQHTLTFNSNGGTKVSPETVTVLHGATVSAPLLPPTRDGYTFTGWYDDAACTVKYDFTEGLTADATVYAGWKAANPVVVTYTLTINYEFTNGKTAAASVVLDLVPGASYEVDSPRIAGYWADRTVVRGTMPANNLTETVVYRVSYNSVIPAITKKAPELNTKTHIAYVEGYPDGTIRPKGEITRAEVAAILYRLMTDSSRDTYYSTKSGFRDVASGSWYNIYVATLNNAGVITDSSNGYFRPNDAITRAELAAMLARFTETTGAANYFNDVPVSHWAANAIAVCAKLGWINGYPDGSFRPDNHITRAEMMAMVNRATGRTPKSEATLLSGLKVWSDNADKTAWYYLDVQEATNTH